MDGIVIILIFILGIALTVLPSILQQKEEEKNHQKLLEDIAQRQLKVRQKRMTECMQTALSIAQKHNRMAAFQKHSPEIEKDYSLLFENDLVFGLLWDPNRVEENNPDLCSYIFSVAFYHLFNFDSTIKEANLTKEECMETMRNKIRATISEGYMHSYFAIVMWQKCDLLQKTDDFSLFPPEDIEDDFNFLNETTNNGSKNYLRCDFKNDSIDEFELHTDEAPSSEIESIQIEDCMSSFLPNLSQMDPILKKATRIVNLFKCHLNDIFLEKGQFGIDIRNGWINQLESTLKQNPQEILDDFAELEKEEKVYLMSINLLLAELKSGKYYFMCDLTPVGHELCDFTNDLTTEALEKGYLNQEKANNIKQQIIDTIEEYRIFS